MSALNTLIFFRRLKHFCKCLQAFFVTVDNDNVVSCIKTGQHNMTTDVSCHRHQNTFCLSILTHQIGVSKFFHFAKWPFLLYNSFDKLDGAFYYTGQALQRQTL